MISIIFAGLCVVVISAESSPMTVNSYSSSASALNDYDMAASNYNEMSSSPYITTGSSSLYSKSDTRYAADSTDSDPRASQTNSYYKTKYGSDSVINAIRPTYSHPSSSSSSSSSASSSGQTSSSSSPSSPSSSSEHQSTHYTNSAPVDYSSSQPSSPSNSEYIYGDRQPERQASYHYQSEHPGASSAGTEYGNSRPVYSSYTAAGPGLQEYTRPTGFAHGGPPSPPAEHSSHPYHHPYHHQHHHAQPSYNVPEDYQSPSAPHPYKTYVMSSGPPASSYQSKYSSVMSALKSLFGGGSGPMMSDAAPSPSHHVSPYSSSPYFSNSMMHHSPGSYSAASAPSASISSGGSPYYFGSGLGPSSASAYSKSYPPMRLMSSYGGSPSSGSKIIVIRGDGGASGHAPGYPSSSGSIIGSPSSYVAKSKLAYASSGAPSYMPSSSSSMGYSSGSPSSAYPGSYSSSTSFASHGGSPFLGYTS